MAPDERRGNASGIANEYTGVTNAPVTGTVGNKATRVLSSSLRILPLVLDDRREPQYLGGHRMSFADRTLTCADCGATFTFTAGEQEFHASKGFNNEPRRCPSCRQTRRDSDGGGGSRGGGGPREMFDALCASCGKTARVPFQPRGDRPVYCSDCFQSQPRSTSGGGGGYGGGGGGSRRW
jgi:CxxC-x17-CxxC domain-containing protein